MHRIALLGAVELVLVTVPMVVPAISLGTAMVVWGVAGLLAAYAVLKWPEARPIRQAVLQMADYLRPHLAADRAEALRELAAIKQRHRLSSLAEIQNNTNRLEQLLDAIGLDNEGRRYFGRLRLHDEALKIAQHMRADSKEEMAWRNDESAYHRPLWDASIRALDRWLRGEEAATDFAKAVADSEWLKPDQPVSQHVTTDPDSETFQLIRTARYEKPPESPFRREIKRRREEG